MQTIVLVSCVSKKQNKPSPAKDLYLSEWFLKASAYAKKLGDRWLILSAKYGLLDPNQVIAPYDLTLKTMSVHAKRYWAIQVLEVLMPILTAGDTVVFLAGEPYRENLVEPLRKLGCQISIPMKGLRIGEQLRWLTLQSRGKR